MKANEFVRKYGLDEATAFLSLGSDVEIVYTASFFDDLKRLVESHELVEKVGGLDDARHRLLHLALIDSHKEMKVLASAIADVESCMEVSSESN